MLSSGYFSRDAVTGNHPNALQPRSENSLNASVKVETPSKKRKLSELIEGNDLGGPVTIFPHGSHSNQPLVLKLRRLIPRSSLPLTYLGFHNSAGVFQSPRLFQAHIKALQHSYTGCNDVVPQVLIAEESHDSPLYAIEAVAEGTYALCSLAKWVSLDDLGRNPPKALKREHNGKSVDAETWWRNAAVDIGTKPSVIGEASATLSRRRLSMKPPGAISQLVRQKTSVAADAAADGQKSAAAATADARAPPTSTEVLSTELSRDEVLGTLRAQYLETLYASKTSLAYFAKGPLSRARAAFRSQDGATSEVSLLTDFLRSSILSIMTNDKKYSTTLPDLVKDIPFGIMPDDEELRSIMMTDSMKRSKRRKKLSKGGMWPGEEEHVVRWWITRESLISFATSGDARDVRTTIALAELRARETQLQVLLILEVLALDATSKAENAVSSTCLDVGTKDSSSTGQKKPKKPQDLSKLLDVLIDRLCIWESTSHIESQQPGDSQLNTIDEATRAVDKSCNEQLRDFCTEVIVPFYGTRLPDLYSSICQNLAVGFFSPPRPRLQRSSSTSKLATKPGSAVQQPHPKPPRKTLERVLTDEQLASKRRPAALSRSATDSAVPNFKREPSDISILNIPVHRPGIQQSGRYSQREVDLTAVSQAAEAKMKRKAAIDKELKGAIATLKRPNPRMAVKELVESADRRTADVNPRSRKPQHPMRNPFAVGVQVMATPKANRYPRLPSNGSRPNEEQRVEAHEPETIPPSSMPRVPASVHRPGHAIADSSRKRHGATKQIPPPRPHFRAAVEATPSRRPSKLGRGLAIPSEDTDNDENLDAGGLGLPQLPPLKPQHAQPVRRAPQWDALGQPQSLDERVPSTPSKAAKQSGTTQRGCVQATPVKQSRRAGSDDVAAIAPASSARASEARPAKEGLDEPSSPNGRSIYAALGWDDEGVDELM